MRNLCCAIFIVGLLMSGCTPYISEESETGREETVGSSKITFRIDGDSYKKAVQITEESAGANALISKNVNSLPGLPGVLDTNNYILKVINSSGKEIYSGAYASRPEVLNVTAGTYTVRVLSREFKEPEQDFPLFGDEQTVKVKKDSTARVALISSQLTGGIKLAYTSNFTRYFKGTGVYMKKDSAVAKCFYYSPHYVFFYPGDVSVIYKNKDGDPSYTPDDIKTYVDTVLLTRKLKAGDMVTIKLDYVLSKVTGEGIKISVDTARNWVSEYFNLGSIAPYGSNSIFEAGKAIGDTMTVFGYIVGGDLTSSSVKRKAPFTSKTHFAIATNSWQSLREKCMGVELSASSKFRGELNLVDNPGLLGKPIIVRGTIVDSYMGYPGMKSLKFYKLL
jgi:hypothetical protein